MDMNVEKCMIKFIDIVLDLYWPVPYEVRNEMRNLQNTLMFGKFKQLEEYIENLEEKLTLKNKQKMIKTSA